MDDPIDELFPIEHPRWESESGKTEYLQRWRDTAFHVALGKLLESEGNIETVVQSGEAFGRGLSAELIKNKPIDRSIQEWFTEAIETVLKPLGNDFLMSEISPDQVKTVLKKCPIHESSDELNVAGLFNYGFLRGLLLSAFPNGELLMGSTMSQDTPMTEFIFKAQASYLDRRERERVKTFFASRKLDD